MFSSLTVIKAIEDSYFLSFGETYKHKKRSTAVLQPLLTLNLILCEKNHITNVRFPLLSSKFQNVPATSFVFLSLNFTVFAHGLTF